MPKYEGVRQKGGKWYYRINHRRENGKRYQTEHGGYVTAQDAYYARLEHFATMSKPKIEPNEITVVEFVDQYMEHCTQYCKESTLRQYIWLSQCVKEMLADEKLCEFKTKDVSNLCKRFGNTPQKKRPHLKNSQRSVVHMRNFLSGMFEHAIEMDVVQVNPVTRYHAPEPERVAPRYWTTEELQTFLDEVSKSRYGIAFSLMAGTGCRIGEIVALRWRHVDFDSGKISIALSRTHGLKGYIEGEPKKGSFRAITLPEQTIKDLHIHKMMQDEERLMAGDQWTDDDLVVGTALGRHVAAHNLRMYMDRVVTRLGLPPLSPHGMRHTHATLLLAAGKPLKAVAERLGQSDPSVTARVYAHVLHTTEKDLAGTMNDLLRPSEH